MSDFKITSKNNPLIKYILRLLYSSKFRHSENKFVIEGFRLCKESTESEFLLNEIFYSQKFYNKQKKFIFCRLV